MTHNLFSEFEEISAKQWKQKIQYDLKGADYNQTLVWKSFDGIDIKPFYHPEESPAPIPANPPASWNICEKIYVTSAEQSNKKALEKLEKGAESLWFIIPSEEIDINHLFTGMGFDETPVYLEFKFLSASYLSELKNFLADKKYRVHIQIDIVGNLARTGNWFQDLKKDHKLLEEILTKSFFFQSVVNVDAGLYQNAGANIPQQLAYALAHANEYLNHLAGNPDTKDTLKKSIFTFQVSVGPNYFFEIAKLRALRILYATLAKEYQVQEECHIIAQPSKRNKTLYDFNVNLLRTTTECMSAILGGADSICNMPYDALYHKNNEFGDRIARNQLLVLKNESYFEKISNPAEGSYYIESLTQQFAEKALDIFKEIENGGGFLKQLKEGIIQKKIAGSAQAEQDQFDKGELILTGTNKYANPKDRMKDELVLYPFLKQNPRKTLIQPILEKRLAEKLEQKRLKQEEGKIN